MARALALLLAALTVADAARPRTTRALALRGGSWELRASGSVSSMGS